MSGSTQTTSSVKPGLLIVTMYEAKGLTLPTVSNNGSSQASMSGSVSNRPQSSARPSQTPSSRPGTASSRPGTSHQHGIHPRYLPYCVLEFDKCEVFVLASSSSTSPEQPTYSSPGNQYKFDVSRDTDLSVQLFLRNPNSNGSNRENDIFLGSCKVQPSFQEPSQVQASSKTKSGTQTPSSGQSGVEWVNLGFGSGSIRIGVEFLANPVHYLLRC